MKVNFNDLSFFDKRTSFQYNKGIWRKDHIMNVKLLSDASYIEITENDGFKWKVSHENTNNAMGIDSINSIPLSSNEHLFDILTSVLE